MPWPAAATVLLALLLLIGVSLPAAWRWHQRQALPPHPTAKPHTSDQAPGEEVVQVNDRYVGGAPPPENKPDADLQHPTGG